MASVYFKPNDKDALSLFGLLFPFLFLMVFLLTPFLYSRQKITFFFSILSLGIALPQMLSYVRYQQQDADPRRDLTVLTYNVMMGFGLVDYEQEPDPKKLEKLNSILSQDPKPDILCLQEAGPLALKAFDKISGYPYSHSFSPKGAVVYSAYPIVKNGFLDFKSKINSCLWADIALPTSDTVRIYSAHLESTRLSSSSYNLLAEKGLPSPSAQGIKDLLLKYPLYAGKRAEQAHLVNEHMTQSPYPVVLCGDMNEPPASYTYRVLKKDMTDAFEETGSGFGNTWKGKIPILRIDYIFASEKLTNTSDSCLRSDLSDHYPVKASFTFNEE